MQNDFEIIYYCILNDDVALNLYLDNFTKYLWGMLHRIVFRAERRNEIYEMGAYDLLIDLLDTVSFLRTKNVKAFFSSALAHEIKRINSKLSIKDAKSCYMDDSESYASIVASVYLRDDEDPCVIDYRKTLIDHVYEVMNYNLSSKQQRAIENCIAGKDEQGFKDYRSYQNALYQARKKIKESMND